MFDRMATGTRLTHARLPCATGTRLTRARWHSTHNPVNERHLGDFRRSCLLQDHSCRLIPTGAPTTR